MEVPAEKTKKDVARIEFSFLLLEAAWRVYSDLKSNRCDHSSHQHHRSLHFLNPIPLSLWNRTILTLHLIKGGIGRRETHHLPKKTLAPNCSYPSHRRRRRSTAAGHRTPSSQPHPFSQRVGEQIKPSLRTPRSRLSRRPPSRLTRAVSCPTSPADLPSSASRRSQVASRVAPRSEPHRRALAVGAAKPVARPAPSFGTRPASACKPRRVHPRNRAASACKPRRVLLRNRVAPACKPRCLHRKLSRASLLSQAEPHAQSFCTEPSRAAPAPSRAGPCPFPAEPPRLIWLLPPNLWDVLDQVTAAAWDFFSRGSALQPLSRLGPRCLESTLASRLELAK
uniref:Uncharacterized protein n=1 Tax=Cucumis melo TaxID=3656 RepID=A0A9I9E9T5_CUCME